VKLPWNVPVISLYEQEWRRFGGNRPVPNLRRM
jgi:hypothetical protein